MSVTRPHKLYFLIVLRSGSPKSPISSPPPRATAMKAVKLCTLLRAVYWWASQSSVVCSLCVPLLVQGWNSCSPGKLLLCHTLAAITLSSLVLQRLTWNFLLLCSFLPLFLSITGQKDISFCNCGAVGPIVLFSSYWMFDICNTERLFTLRN